MQELTNAFQEPSAASKVMVPLSLYRVPMDLYSALFKTPKVEEDMTKQVVNIHPLAINPDLHCSLEASCGTSMASWHFGCHMMDGFDGKCQDDLS